MNYAKYANWYDKDGNIINKKDEHGATRSYTIEELEELVDKLAEDKDENGHVKNPVALNNANAILFQMYQKYGNPHEEDILKAIKEYKKEKTTVEEKEKALQEVAAELDTTTRDIPVVLPMDNGGDDDKYDDGRGEYVEFEEIKENA